MSETIAGDIRRIRNLLRPVDGKGIEVKCNYGELMTLFDAIETKAKFLQKAYDDQKEKELHETANRMSPRPITLSYHWFGDSNSLTYHGTHLSLLDAINEVILSNYDRVVFEYFLEG